MAIKTSDLIQDDNLKELEDKFTKLAKVYEGEIDKMIKKSKELEDALATSNPAGGTEARSEIKKTTSSVDRLNKEYDKMLMVMDKNEKRIAAVKMAQAKLRKERKLDIKLIAAEEGSYDQLSAQYAKMKMQINAMSKAERERSKEGKRLVKQSKKIYEEMDRIQKSTGKAQLSVGKYGNAIKGLGGKMAGMLGIAGGVLGVLAGMFKAFQRSSIGAGFMIKANAVLQSSMSALSGLMSDLATVISDAFENPQQAIADLGQLLLNQIINRVKASIELAGLLGKAFAQLVTGEVEEMKNTLNEAGDAFAKMLTGTDDEGLTIMKDKFEEVKEEVADNTKAFEELGLARRKVREENAELISSIEKLRGAEEVLKSKADDTTRSLKEREEFARQAIATTEDRLKKEKTLAENQLKIINDEIAIREANEEDILDLIEQRAEATRNVIAADNELLMARQENDRTRRELEQDGLERSLDILIDGFDNQKTINERRIRDERKTFAQRRAIAEQTVDLAQASFNKQIAMIEESTGVQINANELVTESDAVALEQKVRALGVSDIIQGRILEAIRDRKTAIQDLTEAQQELNKAEKAQTDRDRKLIEDTEKLRLMIAGATDDEITLHKLNNEEQVLLAKLGALKKTDDAERNYIQAQLDWIKSQRDDLLTEDETKTLWDMMGLDLSEESQGILEKGLQQGIASIQEFTAAAVQAADQRVQAAQREVDQAQSALDTQMQLRSDGYASNVQAAQRDLDLARETERKALEDKRKAQQQQILLDTALQASNLITGVSQIWRDDTIPWFLKIPAVALMFGSFVASKAKALQATQEFSEGDFSIIGGGRHGSKTNGKRNDTLVGFSGNKAQFAEQGEARMILSRKATARYKNILPHLFESLSRGTFENDFLERMNTQIPPAFNVVNATDMSKSERELEQIRKQGEEKVYYLNGKKIVKKGNRIKKANV